MKGAMMAQQFIYAEMNEIGKALFEYELLPESLWPERDEVHIIPKTPIDLYHNLLEYDMFLSLYCHDFKDVRNDCPRCPFSKIGGCNDTDYEKVIVRYNNWRSVSEITNALGRLNQTRSHIVIAMLNRYLDNSYDKPILYKDEHRGYNIDCVFYFGLDILFEDSDIGQALLDDDILYLPFGLIDIADIEIPMPA